MSDFSDPSDRATVEEQRSLEAAIDLARSHLVTRKLQPKGYCHNCNEAFHVGDARLFCDEFCAEDHEKLRRSAQMRGR